MCNIRIVIYGASVSRYYDIVAQLFDISSIIGFVDQDIFRQNICFENIPVFSIASVEKIERYIDVFCIPSWENFSEIMKSLLGKSLKEKVIIFNRDGNILENEENSYNQNVIEAYKRVLKKNSIIISNKKQILDEKINMQKKNRILEPLIAHACGGWIDDKKILYTNSIEALNMSISHGYRYIECDIMNNYGELVLAHQVSDIAQNKVLGLNMAYIKDLFDALRCYEHIYFILDVKFTSAKEYENILDGIDDRLSFFFPYECRKQYKERLIVEVYNEETIKAALKRNFNCIHTNYRHSIPYNHEEQASLCAHYGITNGIICLDIFGRMAEYMYEFEAYLKNDISIFAATVNSIDKYAMLREIGFKGVITDFLCPVVEKTSYEK